MHIERFACNICQCAKPSGPGHGLLPNQDIAGALWEEIAVDLIGPWLVPTPHGIMEFFVLMCIDTATACMFEKSGNHKEPFSSIPGSLGT